MPEPVIFKGERLPASYANFYISNSYVLVPTFNDPKDRIALGILSELFKDRIVTGIHAVDLVWGLGTLHCLTHEQPGRINRFYLNTIFSFGKNSQNFELFLILFAIGLIFQI